MFLQKKFFLLILSAFSILQLNCSQPADPNSQIPSTEEADLQKAKKNFYDSQTTYHNTMTQITNDTNTLTYHAKKAAIDATIQTTAQKMAQGLDYCIRWVSGEIQEEEKLKEENQKYTDQLKKIQTIKEEKETELLKTNIENQKKQGQHIEIQIIRDRMEQLDRACLHGIYSPEKCKEKYADLNEQLENIGKEARLKKNSVNNKLNPSDPKNKNDKNNNADQPTIESTTGNNKHKKIGLIKSLLPYCTLAAVTTTNFLDTIADYSLKPITNLNFFKNTFIGNHQKGINRAIITITFFTVAYQGYSWYKKYQENNNITEEDIFGSDYVS